MTKATVHGGLYTPTNPRGAWKTFGVKAPLEDSCTQSISVEHKSGERSTRERTGY